MILKIPHYIRYQTLSGDCFTAASYLEEIKYPYDQFLFLVQNDLEQAIYLKIAKERYTFVPDNFYRKYPYYIYLNLPSKKFCFTLTTSNVGFEEYVFKFDVFLRNYHTILSP